MPWFAVIGLAIWIFFQERRLASLEHQVADLRALPKDVYKPVTAPAEPVQPEPVRPPVESQAAALADDIQRAVEEARAEHAATLAAEVEAARRLVATPARDPLPPIVRAALEPTRAPAPERPSAPRLSLETWLSENGLAWIGGAALVIGGALLVGFAAQQGFFTPPVRIASAAVLGGLLILTGEALRRGRLARFVRHPLASAIASGAGASVLYGTAWASHALYHFIPAGVCAGLLAAIAAGLLGLALLRGQALALLALAGAYVAPLVAAGGDWSAPVMTAYLGLLVAVGFVVAAERNWRACGWVTFLGAGLWSGLALFEPSALKCLLLGLEPLAVVALLSRLRPETDARRYGDGAVIFASVLSWAAMTQAWSIAGHQALWIGAAAGLILPALTALAVRGRAARSELLAAPAVALVLAALLGLVGRRMGLHEPGAPLLWLAQAAVLGGAILWATWTRAPRAPAATAAVLGMLPLGAFAGAWWGLGLTGASAPLAVGLMLAAGLVGLVRAPGAKDDVLAAEIVSGAAAASLLLAVGLAAEWRYAPMAFALTAVALAGAHLRFGWRSLSVAATGAGVIAFGALFGWKLWAYAFSGLPGAAWELASSLVLAGGAFVAARIIRRRGDDPGLAEAMMTLTPVAVLAGLFVFLRWVAAGGAGVALDALSEASIRTLLLTVGGLTGLRMLRAESGAIAKLRAHGLLLAGLAHAVLLQGLAWNPWWGISQPVAGPPLLDTLALAYLAPGLIFAYAASRARSLSPEQSRIYGWAGAGFILGWAVLEIRRLTHGADLSGGLGTVGALEAVAYSLLWLGAGQALPWLRERMRLAADAEGGAGAGRGQRALAWFGLGFATVMLGLWSNPWWGAAAAPLGGAFEALAVWAGYAVAVALILRTAWRARAEGRTSQADAAEGVAVFLGLALAALLIRWAFRGGDMRWGQPHLAAEIWSYSAAGAALGIGLLAAGRKGRYLARYGLILLLATAAKVLFFDMAQLSGMVRVASFIAVGVLMLAGALTARRMGRRAGDAEATTSEDRP
ncbi:MAG: hypothetical protein JWP35_1054 [Caulobacter sp.]|nr:hypothetical protein [Caulobacter sp.]